VCPRYFIGIWWILKANCTVAISLFGLRSSVSRLNATTVLFTSVYLLPSLSLPTFECKA
jgi:uncharacterized membrane protein YedE/YeeE